MLQLTFPRCLGLFPPPMGDHAPTGKAACTTPRAPMENRGSPVGKANAALIGRQT